MVIPISNILSDLHDLIIWTLKCIVSISYSSECCNCCFCVSFKCLKKLSAHKNFADDQYIIGCLIQDFVKNIQEDINFLMIISVVLDELQGPTETEIKNHLTQYQHCDELYLQKNPKCDIETFKFSTSLRSFQFFFLFGEFLLDTVTEIFLIFLKHSSKHREFDSIRGRYNDALQILSALTRNWKGLLVDIFFDNRICIFFCSLVQMAVYFSFNKS